MAESLTIRRRAKYGRRKGSEFLSSLDVADLLGISAWTLTQWRREHRGPEFIRFTRKVVRYPRAKFEAWLAALPRS